MGESGFRDLFNELPRAIFEALQGIGEAAVKKAQEPKLKPIQHESSLLDALTTDHVGALLCERFGWRRMSSGRNPRDRSIEFGVQHHCRHWHRFEVDEHALHLCADSALNVLDQIADEVDRNPRSCYCTPRPT